MQRGGCIFKLTNIVRHKWTLLIAHNVRILGRLERNCKTMFFPAKHNTLFWMHGVGKVFY